MSSGNGYPRGIRGEDIRLESRILAICDGFDAMISPRPYRKSLSLDEAVAELKKSAGTQYDKKFVACFIEQVLPNLDKETVESFIS